MQLDVYDREFMHSGHMACAGCGATIALRVFTKAMGENTILVVPASCTGVFVGVYPQSAMKIPLT
jgi:pyruvate ferredoxin oxidoreductase beta subunit